MNTQFHLMQTSSARHMLWFTMEAHVHLMTSAVSVKLSRDYYVHKSACVLCGKIFYES